MRQALFRSTAETPEGIYRRTTSLRRLIRDVTVAVAIAIALVWPAYHKINQSCDEEDTAAAQLAFIQSGVGTAPTDEYTPVTADNDSLKPNMPAFWLADSANGIPEISNNTAGHGPAPLHLSVEARKPEFLILNLRDYPEWRVYRNGALVTNRDERDDGLLTIPVPAGRSSIDVRYAKTWDQIFGDLLSAGALLVWIVVRRREGFGFGRSTAAV